MRKSFLLALKTIILSLYFLVILYLNYHQVYYEDFKTAVNPNFTFFFSDTPGHLSFLQKMLYSDFSIPHPFWHQGVRVISNIFHIGVEDAAVIFSSLVVMVWFFMVYWLVENAIGNQKTTIKYELIKIILTFSVVTVGPLCIPWYNKLIFLGQGSPNIWHNVTLWTIKPLALLSMFLTLEAIKKDSTKLGIYTVIVTFISIFAKPSYVMVFLPALLLLIIYRRYYTKKTLSLYLTLALTSCMVLFYQYLKIFNPDARIIVDFFGVWSLWSDNIPISILLALAFPIVFLIITSRQKMNDYLLLSWYQAGFGIMLFAVFAESGERYAHGNFGWSYMLALSFVYLFTILEFIKVFRALSTFRRTVLIALLIIQCAIGIYYLVSILKGYNPVWIRLII